MDRSDGELRSWATIDDLLTPEERSHFGAGVARFLSGFAQTRSWSNGRPDPEFD